MFIGRYLHTIDSKGRVSVPVKFRETLTERYEEKLIITSDFDQCLVAYPTEEWRLIEEKTKSLPMMQAEVKDFMRFFYSRAVECVMDRQGRILIPPSLREYAALNKEVVLIGMFNKIEIWDNKKWEAKESKIPQSLGKISETLSSLGL
ncbi:MAG: division/cell wall cluster transcriptional repressor MraZ [Nitrospirota bacterium]